MKKVLSIAVLAVAVISCENMKEVDLPAESLAFKASIAETKTTLVENTKVHWAAEDAISVFGSEGTNYWVGTAGSGASVTFDQFGQQTVEAGLVASQPYAVYPYHQDNTAADNVITTLILKDQYAVAGDFPSNQKPVLVAKGDASGNLAFQHASNVLKLTIVSDGITYVSIEGNATEKEVISGNVNVTVGDEISTEVTGSWTENYVVLKNEDGTALAQGTYYLVMAPTVFESGITARWDEKDGYDNWKYTGNKVEAIAGHILNLGEIGYVEKPSDATAPTITAFSEYDVIATVGAGKTISVTATDETELASITGILYTGDWSAVLDTKVMPVTGTEATAEYVINYPTAGSYAFAAYATDAAGNQSGWWNTTVTITEASSSDDSTPPAITVTSGDAVAGETYTLVVNFSDESGIKTCWPQVYLATSDWSSYPSLAGSIPSDYWANGGNANWGTTISGNSFDFTLDIIFPAAGAYNVYIWGPISDNMGNGYGAEQVYVGTINVTDAAGN